MSQSRLSEVDDFVPLFCDDRDQSIFEGWAANDGFSLVF